MSHYSIRITVAVFGNEDMLGRKGKLQTDNEVNRTGDTSTVEHLRVLFHVDPRVDQHFFFG